jgi:hypothetical protein
MSLNIHRRHLSTSQRALAAGALARRRQGGTSGLQTQPAGLPVPPTQHEAAALVSVSERLVRDGSLVVGSGMDEIIKAVARGEMTVTAAASLIRGSRADRQAASAPVLVSPPLVGVGFLAHATLAARSSGRLSRRHRR